MTATGHDWPGSEAHCLAVPCALRTGEMKVMLLQARRPTKGDHMSVARSFTNWLTYRRAITELGRLNDRSLRDLGISPGHIPVLARASAR